MTTFHIQQHFVCTVGCFFDKTIQSGIAFGSKSVLILTRGMEISSGTYSKGTGIQNIIHKRQKIAQNKKTRLFIFAPFEHTCLTYAPYLLKDHWTYTICKGSMTDIGKFFTTMPRIISIHVILRKRNGAAIDETANPMIKIYCRKSLRIILTDVLIFRNCMVTLRET